MPLTPGSALGPYEIQAPLGAGGMGEVYKARDTRLGRSVAIKVLSEAVASDPAFRRRFEREGKTISSLNQPHMCALYDVGEQDGVRYLVMEHVDGETLADKLGRDGALPVDDAARYATQIADALEAAHETGIVHRDLKPGNVMLTKSGCKVLDFGIATYAANAGGEAATQSVAGTAAGFVAGTLPYMSPEALRGSPADARSDVWALGVLLQEMVTGRRPFGGQTAADVTSATLRDQPVRLPDGSPEWLVAVVGRCLAKDPNRRFQRAGEVRAALETSSAATTSVAAARPVPNAWAHAYLGMALVMQGSNAEGLAELREANRLEAEPLLRAFLAHGYAISGQEAEARELLPQLEEISRQEYLCAYEIGVAHEALGDSDEAIAWLRKARDDRADCVPYLGVDPRLDSLRSDPRFQALLDEIGFVTAR